MILGVGTGYLKGEFFALGVDGLFTDYTDTALKARDESCPMAP